MLIDGNHFGISHPCIVRCIASCIVRGIATAHRSCLVRSKGQPSATKVRIDGTLGECSPFPVHRSFAMLVSRLMRCAVFDNWCDSVGSKKQLWRGDFGDANTSFKCNRGAMVVRSKQVVVDRIGYA
jgi:hypothetical protein